MHVQSGATINELSEDANGQHQAAAPSHTKVRFMLSKSVFCFKRRDTFQNEDLSGWFGKCTSGKT